MRGKVWVAGAVLFGIGYLPHRSAGAREPDCALAVTVEGLEGGPAMQEKLTGLARQEGACDAGTWALRVSPAPKGAFIVALWNGTRLETRFVATRTEVQPVSSLLLRVAVAERGGPGASGRGADPSHKPGSDAAKPGSVGEGAAPPAAAHAGVFLGAVAGPEASDGGVGGRAGALGLVLGRHFGGGLFADYGAQGLPLRSRRALEVGGVGTVGLPLGALGFLGAYGELGFSAQTAEGEAAGARASASARGVLVGGGALALFAVSPHLRIGARLGFRWSGASSSPTSTTREIPKETGNGDPKGKGRGLQKTTTETTIDPASQEAGEAIGGLAGAVSLVVGWSL